MFRTLFNQPWRLRRVDPTKGPRLPAEIMNQIFNELTMTSSFAEKAYALKSWALVCSSFRDMAQSHLFRSIHIILSKSRHTRTKALLGALTSSPRLREYVEDILLAVDITSYDASWPEIPHLPWVRAVTVTTAGTERRVPWAILPYQLRYQIHDMNKWPSLHVVLFSDILSPPAITDTSPAVCLDIVIELDTPLDSPPAEDAYTQSISLSGRMMGLLSDTDPGQPDPSERRCILEDCGFSDESMWKDEQQFRKAQDVLELAGTYLGQLGDSLLYSLSTAPHIHLPDLHNLRSINFAVKGPDSLFLITRILASILPHDHLVEVTFNHVPRDLCSYAYASQRSVSLWSAIDEALYSALYAGYLRRVVVMTALSLDLSVHEDEDEMWLFFSKAMPRLSTMLVALTMARFDCTLAFGLAKWI
ncbi:hypothetical protein H0H81_000611 [Sphagnurus paluster]|uniref:F-box domain-containing protein n=1 Tax=Sphagnurus paluster TaxID=117069 RepID=A0A9P7FRA7_9AGAR|nr:hypothetical protein H0H81_000611 [Sphagnurus paluster]